MKKYIVLSVIAVLSFTANTQNLITNGSFELGSSMPDANAQVDRLNGWEDMNTSDWFFNGTHPSFSSIGGNGVCNSGTNTTTLAHTGSGFVGFGGCEGVQSKLTAKTPKEKLVTISFWWSPANYEDTKINVYLLEDQVANSIPNCNNPGINNDFHRVVNVNSAGADAEHFPGTWYYYESQPFLIIDRQYEWLAIKGEGIGAVASCDYIYIDDVSVTSTSACYHICTPKDVVSFTQIVGQPNVLATAMIGNSSANWDMLVTNAADIEFEVFNRWGNSVFYYHAYDPNGLKDLGYTDYDFEWNGEDNDGDRLPFGQYSFNLTLKNCRHFLKYLAEPLFIIPALTTPVQNPPTQVNVLNKCCKPNKTYNNITFQTFREDVDDFIHAGTGGPTIVPINTTVKFYAGNEIVLGNGFQAVGNFIAEIVPCGSVAIRPAPRTTTLITQEVMDSLTQFGEQQLAHTINAETRFDLYPNPTTGVFNVDVNTFGGTALIEVYSIVGKQVFSKTISNNKLEINITNQPKGVYFVKVTLGENIFNEKIIYQ